MSLDLGPKIVVATHNAGKLREISALLAPLGIEAVSAGALGLPEPEETGTSFAENAAIKALAAARASGLPALSDDSGLAVAALGGAPGVYSADWSERGPRECVGDAEPGRDWYLAMGKVEGKLAELGPDASRAAAFHCCLCVAFPDGGTRFLEGTVAGALVWPPRGGRGFGYDPMFVADGETETFGEMDPVRKQAMSHRADAFGKLLAALGRG